ncbi:hypothetical protein RvY_19461 [Ramazzottius varieornatus]|nr:hypothetical protein RvY_19461 [Ramazzottius varieornatus]
MYYPLGKRYPKQKNPQPSGDSSCSSVASGLISSSTPLQDPNHDLMEEAEGEVYVYPDRESDMWLQQPDFSEPEVHTEADSIAAIYEYYHTLEDICRLDVFVISCVPAIYASGTKKSAVLPLNRPLELAVTTFNLKEGRGIGFVHAFVSPGNLPSLTHADADECRLERHGIPYAKNLAPDDDTVQEFYRTCKVDEDYLNMYKRILNFLGVLDIADAHKFRLPPVCCPLSELEVNSECVRWLHAKAEEDIKKQNLTLELPRLQFASLEAFSQMAVFHKFKSGSPVGIFADEDPLKRAFAAHKYYISLQTLK